MHTNVDVIQETKSSISAKMKIVMNMIRKRDSIAKIAINKISMVMILFVLRLG